jgi:D-alanyl-D-alanine carboxypeptidase
VPIASLTKLMTAMVVLDAKQDMDEKSPSTARMWTC